MACKTIAVGLTYSENVKALLSMTSWTMMPLSPPTVFMEALH